MARHTRRPLMSPVPLNTLATIMVFVVEVVLILDGHAGKSHVICTRGKIYMYGKGSCQCSLSAFDPALRQNAARP